MVVLAIRSPHRLLSPTPPPSSTGSVQELIDTAPGDVECPSCSEPLTVDLSGGSPGADDEDEQEATGAAESGSRARGRGGGKGAAKRGRSRSNGRGGGRGGEVKGRMAGAVAALEASVKTAKAGKKSKPGGGGVKRSVRKHSVINRIDLNKFKSVSRKTVAILLLLLLFYFIFLFFCARVGAVFAEARGSKGTRAEEMAAVRTDALRRMPRCW